MDRKINVLFVSISFPPKSDAECLQAAKYFHYLQQDSSFGIEVITSQIPTLYMKYDAKLEPYAKGFKHQIAVPIHESRWLNKLRNIFKISETVFPDSKSSFHKQSRNIVSQIQHTPDVIYSRSYPLSSTILAYKLQRHYSVPWIMHLSDPWADAPLHNWSERYKRKHRHWERKCIEQANYVCLTSAATVSFYRKNYPHLKDKFLLFPNVYEKKSRDNEHYPNLNNLFQPGKLTIVYTGGMAGERSPIYLLRPLQELLKEYPEIEKNISVIFAGEADRVNRIIFEQSRLTFVHYLGKVSFTEAQFLQEQADLLLVIDNPIALPEMAMFFPSKLLDYIVAQKRILAITTKGSATDIVMQDLKGESFAHQEIEQIKNAILSAISRHAAGDSDYFRSDILPLKYEAKFNADRLGALIKSLVHV